MSTRSRIAIILKNEDKGKVFFPKENLLYGKLYHEDKGAEDVMGLPTLHSTAFEKNVVSIYHHYVGYPTGVGITLMNHYNDYEKVRNLMLFGDASSINAHSDTDNILFYNYWRNEDWNIVQPRQNNGIKGLKDSVRKGGEEYCYLYQPNENGEYEWYVASVGKKITFRKLECVLEKETKD